MAANHDNARPPQPPVRPWTPTPEPPNVMQLPISIPCLNHYDPRGMQQPEPPRSLLLVTSSYQRRIQNPFQLPIHHPTGNPSWDDHDLFQGLRRAYDTKLRTDWDKYFSLKGLKLIRLLEYTPSTRPVEVEMSPIALEEIMSAFRNPKALRGKTAWILWIFQLKAITHTRYALEFVTGWDKRKVLIAGAIPWIASLLTACLWSTLGGTIQDAIAIGSFMLALSGGVVAMLAFLSTLEN